jgi:hypothetical protein
MAGMLPMLVMTDISQGVMSGVLPSLTGALSGALPVGAQLAGSLPRLTGAIAGSVFTAGSTAHGTITGTLPMITGALAGYPLGPTDPLSIITSKSPFFFLSADLGITEAGGAGTGVSAWADQSGQGKSATQISSAPARPAWNSSGGPNSRGIVTFNGTNNWMEFTSWDPPAPGTTPIWFFWVCKPVSWSSGANLYSGSSTAILRCRMGTTTGKIGASNGTLGQELTNFTVGSWFRGENLFSNSTSDYIKVGSTSTTLPGTNTGSTNPGSGVFRLCTDVVTRFGNIAWGCFGAWNGEPTSAEKTALSTWVTRYYGNTVGV